MNESLSNLIERAIASRRAGRRIIACLVVKARGSTPQTAGALMLVDEDLNTFGTIGGGCVEAEVRRRAHELLMRDESGVVKFKLDSDYGWDDGLICGGTIEMAIAPLPAINMLEGVLNEIRRRRPTILEFEARTDSELAARFTLDVPPRDRLYIAGAGHVGQALARLATPLEFETTIFDDREDLLQRFAPPGCLTIAGDIATQLRAAPVDDRTYVVIVTRGHKHDEQALHAAVGRGAKYLGMIGSRRKIKLIFDDLKAMGVDPRALAEVHAPIGLDIRSVTVEEIALSIAGELVQVRRADHRSPVRVSDASPPNMSEYVAVR
jgi:xanthine dehydrogenase accessory factor